VATYNKFVDAVNGNDANTAADTDNALATFAYAFATSTAVVADTIVWIRRNLAETISGTQFAKNNGTSIAPIVFAGCPRVAKTTTGDFTNGSDSVTNVASADMDILKHIARWFTAPDGNRYQIRKITSATQIELNRAYIGTTASTGSFTIDADAYKAEWDALDDSSWTIKKATWEADSDNQAYITAGGLNMRRAWQEMCNMRFEGTGVTTAATSINLKYKNVFFDFRSSGLQPFLTDTYGDILFILENCYIEGTHYGNHFLRTGNIRASGVIFEDVYYIMMPGFTLGEAIFQKCCFGVGIASSSSEFSSLRGGINVKCINCRFNASVVAMSSFNTTWGYWGNRIGIQNYDLTDGDNRLYLPAKGSALSNDGSGADVNLRTGGALYVIDVFFDSSASYLGKRNQKDTLSSDGFAGILFEHKIWQTDLTEKTYRYYVQSDTDALTSSELWIEVEDVYGNITKSTQSITARDDADDWDQYVEAACTNQVAGFVTIRGFCAKYSATKHRFIDPKFQIDGSDIDTIRPVWVNGESKIYGISEAAGGGGGGGLFFGANW